MHKGSLFRFVINPGTVGGVMNDLPGVGTTARQSGGTEDTTNQWSASLEPPINQPTAGAFVTSATRVSPAKAGIGERKTPQLPGRFKPAATSKLKECS